ncbi:MAG: hypothetical protein R3D52_09835 [Xanthobacteraceae bacterium]
MSIIEPWTAAIVLLVLLGGSALGLSLQRVLSEHHRSAGTTALVSNVIIMLSTFAALVLSLLITDAKASFNRVDNWVRTFAIGLIELDDALRNYGAEADPIRSTLRTYVTKAIATTWNAGQRSAVDGQAKPLVHSIGRPELDELWNSIHFQIRELNPNDAIHRRLASECNRRVDAAGHTRLQLIEHIHRSITPPFYLMLIFWLVVIYAGFGVMAPHNVLVYTTLAVGALSVASAMFVLLELDTPFAGLFTVPSQPMRDALMRMGG